MVPTYTVTRIHLHGRFHFPSLKKVPFSLVGFYAASTVVGHLMPNPLYTYVWDIYDLVWLDFMAYQPF